MNKNKLTESAINIVLIAVILAAISCIIYGCYWAAKTTSYRLFYEDMVQDTVREMVNPEYLSGAFKD